MASRIFEPIKITIDAYAAHDALLNINQSKISKKAINTIGMEQIAKDNFNIFCALLLDSTFVLNNAPKDVTDKIKPDLKKGVSIAKCHLKNAHKVLKSTPKSKDESNNVKLVNEIFFGINPSNEEAQEVARKNLLDRVKVVESGIKNQFMLFKCL